MLTLYHYCMYCQIRLDTREFSDIRPEKPNIRSIPTCRHHRPRRSISGIAHRCRSPASRSQTPEIYLVRTQFVGHVMICEAKVMDISVSDA